MSDVKRTCGTCVSFDDGSCMNLVSEPVEADWRCDSHETQAEYDADVKAIEVFRTRIGLPPNRDTL